MYVPDPTRCMSAEEAKHDLSYASIDISEDEREALKELEGHAFHVMSRVAKTGGINVIILEWVSAYQKRIQTDASSITVHSYLLCCDSDVSRPLTAVHYATA
jgi:hypothetical protein